MTHSERRPFSTKARWALQITSCSKKKKRRRKKKKPHTPTDSTLEPINSQISFLYLPRHFLPTFGFSPPLPLPPLSIYARGKSCSFKWTFWNPLFYARVFFFPVQPICEPGKVSDGAALKCDEGFLRIRSSADPHEFWFGKLQEFLNSQKENIHSQVNIKYQSPRFFSSQQSSHDKSLCGNAVPPPPKKKKKNLRMNFCPEPLRVSSLIIYSSLSQPGLSWKPTSEKEECFFDEWQQAPEIHSKRGAVLEAFFQLNVLKLWRNA